MKEFIEVKTVLGKRKIGRGVAVLPHEHITCFSHYLKVMSAGYLNRNELIKKSVSVLKAMKQKYNLGLLIDCTPLNIGRDIELLKEISELSEVGIACSTGFYYNDEPILNCMTAEALGEFIIEDAKNTCSAVIKAAVEYNTVSDFNFKLLNAAAIAQRKTGLPVILHTNAVNRNGVKAVEFLLEKNVTPSRLVVGHLSDTDDAEYIKSFASLGCFVALDRIYDNKTEEYIKSKINVITELCEAGYEDRILLSHDDAVFMGFSDNPQIKNPRWDLIFDYIKPKLDPNLSKKIFEENPLSMLCGNGEL